MKCSKPLKMIACAMTSALAFACAENPGSNNNNFVGSSASEPATASYDYSGPGSAYSIQFDELEGTFVIGIADSLAAGAHTWIYGDFERFDTGFTELTVSEATGTAAPSEGDVAMAIEAPGFGIVLRPFGGDAEFVPTVISESCPTADMAGNWILTACNDGGSSCDAESTSIGFFGTFAYDATAEEASFPASYDIETATDLGSRVVITDECSYGIMDNADTALYLSNEDAAIVHESTDDTDDTRHAFSLPQQELEQTRLAGDYYGMAFDKNDDSGTALHLLIDVGGATGTIVEIDESDLEGATVAGAYGTIAITSVNQIGATSADGWITASFTEDGGPTRPLYCTAAEGIGSPEETVLICVGQSAADEEEFLNFMFVGNY